MTKNMITTFPTPCFRAPEASRSTRSIPRRSKGSSRGGLVGTVASSPDERIFEFESGLEKILFYLLFAMPDLHDLWDQPPPIIYCDARGKRRTHHPDCLATLASGKRILYAVKPEARVEKTGFRETLRHIRAATPLSYADDVLLFTDRSFTRTEALNAARLHDFGRVADPEAERVLRDALTTITTPSSIADLCDQTGLGGRGFRAAFRLIFAGVARAVDPGEITRSTRILPEARQ